MISEKAPTHLLVEEIYHFFSTESEKLMDFVPSRLSHYFERSLDPLNWRIVSTEWILSAIESRRLLWRCLTVDSWRLTATEGV